MEPKMNLLNQTKQLSTLRLWGVVRVGQWAVVTLGRLECGSPHLKSYDAATIELGGTEFQ